MGGAMTFEQWKAEVDWHLMKMCGLDQMFLPDWLRRDAYESGMTPREGALECLESAGLDFERLFDEA